MRDHFLAAVDGDDAGALHEARRAGVLYSMSLPGSAIIGAGATIQPRRHPVISQEHIARIDPVLGCRADEFRRRLVRLAEPEWQHVAAAHARIGHLADARSAKALNDGPGERRIGNIQKQRMIRLARSTTKDGLK